MVRPLLLLPAVLMIGAAVSAAPYQEGSTQGGNNGAVPVHSKEIYKIDCAICHGDNGDGKTDLAQSMNLTLTDFTDPKTFQGKSDQELFDLIRKGKGQMPPEDAGRAKDADVHGLILYIRSMSNGHTSPPAPAPSAAPAAKPASPSGH